MDQFDDERTARAHAEAAQRRIAFLYQVTSTLFAGPLDARARLTTLANLVVPDLADWCVVDMVNPRTPATYERVAVNHWDPERIERLGAGAAQALPLPADAAVGVPKVLARGRSEMVTDVSPALLARIAASPDRLLALMAARSYLIVPLAGAEGPVGAMTFVFAESNRRYGSDDLALAEDLAQRAALALENARLYQQAREAVQLREELLAIVSHDLRNPLSTIATVASLLQKAEPTAQSATRTRDHGARLRRSVQRMERLIRDLLAFASIGSGHLTIDAQPVPVSDLMREAAEAIAPAAGEKRVLVTVADATPGLVVSCDKERILQVLSNLLGNAVKFSPAEGLVRLVSRGTVDEVELSVSDGGPGIPPEALAQIFERFWQAKETARQGTGLGLYIAKGIVEAHGGRIWADSIVGQGSTFRFVLPLHGGAALKAAAASGR
jgi:signal transduction histidine kinase